MADFHEARFLWPHSEPTHVILTGTFDQWSRSMQLAKGPSGFKGSVKMPWEGKISYKFIVDGQWMLVEHEPTEPDHDGNLNNVYMAPPKPPSSTHEADPAALVSGPASVTMESVHRDEGGSKINDALVPPLEESKPTGIDSVGSGLQGKHADQPIIPGNVTGAPEAGLGHPLPRMIADLTNTVAAREGTISALDYVTSGLGAAIRSVVGIDPINAEQVAIPSPDPESSSSPFREQVSTPVLGVIAPDAPTTIAVNTPDNNATVAHAIPDISHEVSPDAAPITPPKEATGAVTQVPPTHVVVSTESGAPPPAPTPMFESITADPVSSEVQRSKSPVTTAEAPRPEIPSDVELDTISAPTSNDFARNQGNVIAEPSTEMTIHNPAIVSGAGRADGSHPTNESDTNGRFPAAAAPLVDKPKVESLSTPTAPAKDSHRRFTSSSSSSSPAKSISSKAGTKDSRKRKGSFFQKVKHLFSHDKEKKKETGVHQVDM